jgi:SAM-dependent methyltransferase
VLDPATLEVPLRLDPRLITYFPRAPEPGVAMLDLACGSAHHRRVCEATGHRYIGVDMADSMRDAAVLADGRFLPFRDGVFGFTLSIATLEHIPHPELMIREIHRVLRPGGRLVGTAAFLEPEHDGSYFHMSRLGVERLLRDAGFEVAVVAPVPGWSVLDAQARMSLFPRLPGRVSRALVAPLKALHLGWWRAGERLRGTEGSSDLNRALSTAGAICFVADKRIDDS